MCSKIRSDVFGVDRYILNGMNIRLEMRQSPDSYRLMAEDKATVYRVKIIEATLIVCIIELSSKLMLDIGATLEKHPAIYNFKKWNIEKKTISTGDSNFQYTDLFQSKMPEEVYVMLCKAASQDGDLHLSPYNLVTGNLKYLRFAYGDESLPTRPMQFTYPNQYTDGFWSLFSRKNSVSRLGIDYTSYPGGYSLYVFSLSNVNSRQSAIKSIDKFGVCKLEGVLAEPATEAYNVYIIGIFHAQLEVTSSRMVKKNY